MSHGQESEESREQHETTRLADLRAKSVTWNGVKNRLLHPHTFANDDEEVLADSGYDDREDVLGTTTFEEISAAMDAMLQHAVSEGLDGEHLEKVSAVVKQHVDVADQVV